MFSRFHGFLGNSVVPLGGNVMSYASKYRIHLDGENNDRGRARLELSPSHPQADAFFAIDKTGFRNLRKVLSLAM
ncbi:MAG: hypothetical protein WAM14_14805 [Candidatus Nitrosopolaris sp.]